MLEDKWYEKVNNNENFKNNYRKVFKKYPNGISPYIVGIPVYAEIDNLLKINYIIRSICK